MVWRRFVLSVASARIVTLKFVMRSLSVASFLDRAAKMRCCPEISFERSRASVPSSASLTTAPPRSAPGEYSSESFRALPAVSPRVSSSWSSSSPGRGSAFSAPPNPTRSLRRSARVSDLSVPSTWSIWTGAEVCDAGIVEPLSTSGAPGVPGWMSKKRLPSKKMRGRTLIRASRWIGSAVSLSFMVTVMAGESPPTGSTPETLPTSTPAIRTAWPLCDRRRVLEAGLQLVRLGERDVLGEGEEGRDQDQDERDQAHLKRGEAARAAVRARHRAPHGATPALETDGPSCPSVFVPWLPGTFPTTVWPRA